jgi:hypothetical protein
MEGLAIILLFVIVAGVTGIDHTLRKILANLEGK